jgi:hypothetical protein
MLEHMRRRLPLRLSIPLMLLGLWGLSFPPDDPKTLIAAAAAIIAGLAWLEPSRSADTSSKSASIAADNEDRRKYGWRRRLLNRCRPQNRAQVFGDRPRRRFAHRRAAI